MGIKFLQNFYYGGNLSFGPTLLMIFITLVGIFMMFTGVILHAISKMIYQIASSQKKKSFNDDSGCKRE
jgi:hypothetical protein